MTTLWLRLKKHGHNGSLFVENHHIAKVDDHSSIMIMKVNDFEAMGAMMSSDEMKAWDEENGCVDVIYNMEEMTE